MRRVIPSIIVLALAVTFILSLVTANNGVRPDDSLAVLDTAHNLQSPKEPQFTTPLLTGAPSQKFDDLALVVPRRNHTSTTMTDGKVIFIGGEGQENTVSEAEILDPIAQTISVVASSVIARASHTATLLPDGKVLVAGGSSQKGALRSTEVFDPATSSFSAGPNLQRPRFGHTATVLEDGRILIAGGCPDNSAEIYDGSTNRFSLVQVKMNISRSFHGAILLSTGDVLFAGGVGFYNGDTAEVFSTKDARFSPTKNWLFANRLRPSLRVLPDGKVQIVGGDREGTMELYDPRTNRFRSHADLSAAAAVFPMRQMLRATTRTAVIQGALNQQRGRDHRQLSVSNDSQDAPGESIARADYSYGEIGPLNRAVIAGGIDSKGRLLRSVVLLDSSPSSLTTDYVEYAQQSNQYLQQANPVITGAGWIPNEEIVIVRQQTETEASIVLQSVADAQGGFTNSDISDNQLGVYILTAVGQSSQYVAQTTYRVGPAPDLESEEATKFKKPVRIKALIPLGGSSGTVQTDLGPMNWKATPLNNVKLSRRIKNERGAKARKPITPMIEDLEAEASNQVELFSFELPWSNVPLSIPSFPVSVNSSGMFSGRGFIEVTASFEGPDCECCWCFPPCSCSLASVHTKVAFVVEYDLTTTNDISFEGEFIKNDILVLPLFEIGAVIPGSPFSLGGVFGLFAGVDLKADRRLTVRTLLNISDNRLRAGVDAGFTLIGIPPGPTIRPILEVDPGSIDGDASLIEFGGASAKLSLGPGVQAILNLGTLPVINCELLLSSTLRAAPFVKATVAPTADSDTCQKFDINISAGLQGDFTGQYFGCGLVSASFNPEFEFFEVPIVSFSPFVFKDTGPPVLSCPSDLVIPTEAGKCSAVVAYQDPQASDDCSGIDSFGCSPPSGATFAKGTSVINCTARDRKGNTNNCSFTVTIIDTERPQLSGCPSNIVTANNPGRCSAQVTYATPSATDNCPGVVAACSPPSGFAFPKGTTVVSCTATDTSSNTANCSFTITVNDTEKPTILCPANQTRLTAAPGTSSTAANYSIPAFSDNCPGASISCAPPSGAPLPIGVTLVVCTTTDPSLNSSQCSFTVTTFDVCLQDDSNPNLELLYNSSTGDYRLCAAGVVLTGKGSSTVRGSSFFLQHNASDRRVTSSLDATQNRGTASLQYGGRTYTITDRDIRNNTISCQ